MLLFKAINYDDTKPKKMSSIFEGKFILESSFEDIITTAFSHISHGNRMSKGDYWISATKSIHTAKEYLNNTKYNFNGIAVINLPNTEEFGIIYDDTLKNFGYIEKEMINHSLVNRWRPNDDGIVTTLDMSSVFTVNYLASYLWLKGNKESLGNIRMMTYANRSDEVLILGENINFTFLSKEEANEMKLTGKPASIRDYYFDLFRIFLMYAPNKNIYAELFKNCDLNCYALDEDAEYMNYLTNTLYYTLGNEYGSFSISNDPYVKFELAEHLGLNEKEIRRLFKLEKEQEKNDSLKPFFKNSTYCFNKNKAYSRFYEFSNLSYEDKDIIDYEKFEVIEKYDDISFQGYLYAYIYSSIYMEIKLNGKLDERKGIWRYINLAYNKKFIANTVRNEDFLNYYKESLGVYANKI